jgi:DNA-binding SARP family transcriptional activator
VSTERLVDAVWADRPPRRAVNTVQTYVMRLRRLLGEDGHRLITTRGRGYELVAGHDDLDAGVFELLLSSGRQEIDAGRAETGVTRLAKALALWRGPVFADVPTIPLLAGRVTRLEQLRLAAQEDHLATLLDLGRHETAVSELHRLVEDAPLRELRWALLMRALAGCGRRAEALEAFQQARRVLRAELGMEPDPRLRELQRAILAETPPQPRVTVGLAGGDPRAQTAAHLSLGTLHRSRGAGALGNLGILCWTQGLPEQAIEHYSQALEIARHTGRLAGQAANPRRLGHTYWALGRLQLSADHLTQALALNRRMASRSGRAKTLSGLGEAYRALGRLDDALDALTQALDLASAALATVHQRLGRYQEAFDGQRQSLDLARNIGSHHTETDALTGLAAAHHQASHHDLAIEQAEAALTVARRAHFQVLEADALAELAMIHLRRDPARAFELAEQALAIHTDTGSGVGAGRAHAITEQAVRHKTTG